MAMREPHFWWRRPSLAAALLAPIAAGYGTVAAARMRKGGARAGVPVLCVGNFTLGGAGKTPTAIALARMLTDAGESVFCLSRGYGGNIAGVKLVDTHTHTAAQVGDEALLLARAAPTIVARDRVAGAKLAHAKGATVVIMDDGLQNGSIAKNFALAVVDARRGVGNARVFPAGPLRAPLAAQLATAHALLVVGDGDAADALAGLARSRGLPVLHGRLVPDAATVMALKQRQVFAFAGIGDPEKFFATAEAAGIAIATRRSFADHHEYTAEEAAALVMEAEHQGLTLLTTEKDHARMSGNPALAALHARAMVLPVTLAVEEANDLRKLALDAMGP
jgi:tetraacyldisaccharide 4'-kinase